MSHPLENLSFQALFNVLADSMLLVDKTGAVVQANSAACELLGYAENEITGMTVEALMPERYRLLHRHHRDSYASKPEKRPMGMGDNLVALCRDGRELAVSIGLTPMKSQGQPFVLITMYSPDRRKQAEHALRISEERLRLAKRVAKLGIFDLNLINDTLHLDERSRELWGMAPEEEVTFDKLLAGIHPEDRMIKKSIIKSALDPAGGGEYQCQFRVLSRNDNLEHWVAMTGRVFFDTGRAVRMVGITQDMTEHKIVERKLQDHRAEMESLLKQQVALQTSSAIAHELNQPLAAVSVYSEVALRALESNPIDMPRLEHALKGCSEQAQRAGKSLHELLQFLHQGQVTPEVFELNPLVQEAISTAKNEGYGHFHPVLDLEEEMPPVICNRLQVQKVLFNLLRNSVEAMHEMNGQTPGIRICTRTMAGKKMAHITVQDSGPGLDLATSRQIFEPFFTTKSTGIGMGLTISRALIEANGGQFWFDAEAGPGATFHFTLPLAP